MTQEEKQLLFKDLCARLPYGVKYCRDSWNYEWDQEMSVVEVLEDIDEYGYINYHKVYNVWDIKPYLRPVSSMTKEELKELNDKYGSIAYFFTQESPYYHGLQVQHSDIGSIEISEFSEIYDWLNARHFDYRGLIERGLALEAPEGMYKND